MIGLSRDVEVMTHNLDKKNVQLKYKFLENELPYQYQLALVSKTAPHKATARLFLNWLLSKEAQDVLEENGFSVGERQKAMLAKKTTWQWKTKEGPSYIRYQSALFSALRELKAGGAVVQERIIVFPPEGGQKNPTISLSN